VILEGIVTTVSQEGGLNIAPMGPSLPPDLSIRRFELRPYRTSTTYANLKVRGEGVFHVTDDVLLLAQTAIGAPVAPEPRLRRARLVDGWVLADSCRYYEFRVVEFDDVAERARITVETLREERLRDFLGFNRARHAVVEAAILATRTALLPRSEILADLERLAVIVAKTGGTAEETAFRLLHDYVLREPERPSPDSTPARS
jgi:hypothetical protein